MRALPRTPWRTERGNGLWFPCYLVSFVFCFPCSVEEMREFQEGIADLNSFQNSLLVEKKTLLFCRSYNHSLYSAM